MNKQFRTPISALAFWLLLGAVGGWFLNAAFGSHALQTGETAWEPGEVDMDIFWDVWEILDDQYIEIEEVDEQDKIYGAAEGLVDALGDPYSMFMDPEETKESEISLNGELEGIGAELTIKNGLLTIVTPIKGTPAEAAGLLPEDIIYEVDGQPTSEMTMMEAIYLIRGEPGTSVTLTILRAGEDEPLEISITRQHIDIPSLEVNFEEYNGQTIAHVNLYQFSNDTDQIFTDAVREVLLEQADGMVLDLRLNGGGYLDVSINIIEEFFEDEVKAVIVKSRYDEENLYTGGGGMIPDLPVVVLIDEGSASASEIVAGALQDYERATIIGEQSFGKGSVQDLIKLQDGATLRLTVAKWFTPDDRSISEVGITPDIQVDMEADAIGTENDIQYQAALDQLTR